MALPKFQEIVAVSIIFVLQLTQASGEVLRLRVATYNVGNYNAADRMTDGGYRKDYPKQEDEKQALKRVIGAMNADIIAFQEMGPQPYLEELRRDLRNEGLNYPYLALVEGSDPERHVALLSKVPLKRSVSHANLDYKYFDARERVKRGVLEAVFETPSGEFTLWVLHLKSRITERSDDPSSALKRAAEAVAIRDMILRRHPDPAKALYLVAGDFNDAKGNRPVRALLGRGNTAISLLLPASDSRSERWTHHNMKDDSYERVDHILASPALIRHIASPTGEAKIADTPETLIASDHRPVWVTLDFARHDNAD
ncbi:MAG: endonuclease/exonuclease/phosphatase family protein [Opitutaceae bacterium]|jgi:endonuclease/exonuclease/phosphatase family metal-dependent hydrolase